MDVLDHLVGVHDVEASVLERPALVQVRGAYVEAVRESERAALLHDLDAGDIGRRRSDAMCHRLRPFSIVTSDVEQACAAIAWNRVEELLAIFGVDGLEQPL